MESVADQTDHFADVFVCENFVYGCDVVRTLWRSKVHSRAILFREIQCKKMDNLMF